MHLETTITTISELHGLSQLAIYPNIPNPLTYLYAINLTNGIVIIQSPV